MISVYTDGSCFLKKGGAGGWGFCYEYPVGTIARFNGSEGKTTNNRMELMAIIKAVEHFRPGKLKIYSDSQYAIGVLSGKWMAHKNQDLVLPFRELAKAYKIEWEWVRGHNGDPMNEIADELAGKAANIQVEWDTALEEQDTAWRS